MKTLLSLLFGLFGCSLLVAEDPKEVWSEPVNGLSARLFLEPEIKSPFLKVFIEFKNMADVMGCRKIRFSPDKLSLTVLDAKGGPLEKAFGPYDGMSPNWETLVLPYKGALRFQISFPGLGYHPDKDKVLIDVGAAQCWSIPDGRNFFLSGQLNIPKEQGDHPYMDWSGVLMLPAIPILIAKSP